MSSPLAYPPAAYIRYEPRYSLDDERDGDEFGRLPDAVSVSVPVTFTCNGNKFVAESGCVIRGYPHFCAGNYLSAGILRLCNVPTYLSEWMDMDLGGRPYQGMKAKWRDVCTGYDEKGKPWLHLNALFDAESVSEDAARRYLLYSLLAAVVYETDYNHGSNSIIMADRVGGVLDSMAKLVSKSTAKNDVLGRLKRSTTPAYHNPNSANDVAISTVMWDQVITSWYAHDSTKGSPLIYATMEALRNCRALPINCPTDDF